VKVSPVGVGTWAWGDTLYWQYKDEDEKDAQEAFTASVDAGINFFDTAEIYGSGRSEKLCGQFARGYSGSGSDEIQVATKFMPLPNRFLNGREAVGAALRDSLERLGTDSCDLYQLHWPSFIWDSEFWDGLADAYEAGLVRSVGVSNYSAKRMRAAHKALEARGVPLAVNQVQYSLLDRSPEYNEVLSTCEELGVKVLAYSPLAQGWLTGKYGGKNKPSGPRGMQGREEPRALLDAMRRIGGEWDKTPSQVALNWVMCKGAIPIPGARNAKQARENAGAMGWRLSHEQVAELDSLTKSA